MNYKDEIDKLLKNKKIWPKQEKWYKTILPTKISSVCIRAIKKELNSKSSIDLERMLTVTQNMKDEKSRKASVLSLLLGTTGFLTIIFPHIFTKEIIDMIKKTIEKVTFFNTQFSVSYILILLAVLVFIYGLIQEKNIKINQIQISIKELVDEIDEMKKLKYKYDELICIIKKIEENQDTTYYR